MPAIAIAWLVGHQAIAIALAAWLGATAAGIDVTDKAVQLYQHIEQSAQEPKPSVSAN